MPRLNLDATKVILKAKDVMSLRMARACQVVVRRTKERLNVTGRASRARGSSGGPSAVGDSPHRVTGRLVTSITYLVYKTGFDTIVGVIGTKVVYGRRLELGFIGTDRAGRNVHQGPRPYLRPALKESAGEIRRELSGGKK